MKKLNKIISILLMIMLVLSSLSSLTNISFASTPIDAANMYHIGLCNTGLRYWSNTHHRWFDVDCYFTLYEKDGVTYPAYCVNADNDGVGQRGPYTVDVSEEIQDVNVEFDMDGDVIWRTIINGYPYKSPTELGVTTVEDAYLVTKRAVHANLYNVDVLNQYSTADAHDVVVLNAINRLTNIGRNGTLTKDDYTMTISKVGDFYKEGNYYVQKFNVTANTTIDTYTITTAQNMPTGAIITNESGTQTYNFNSGDSFYVKVPKASMLENINSYIRALGKCETYPIFYGATRISGTQNYALTYDPYEDLSAATTFNADVFQSGIVIIKTDSETGIALEGVVYNAKYADGTNIGDYTTNEQGRITINNLRPDRVILTEVSTLDEYILDTTPITVDLEYKQIKTIELTNDHKKGNLKIYKVDKDNNRVVLGNVEFDIYSDEFQRVIGTYTTDVNGEIEINNLRTGNYRIIEKKTGKWYNLSEDIDIEIKWDITQESTIENELKKGQIRIIKVDKDNNEVKLAGVKFDVLDKDGNVLETIVTNEEGVALTKKFALRDYETIMLRETETLQNYVLSEETQTITLEENQIKNITFENEMIKGKLEITKVDSKTKETLEGATFGIYDESNTEIAEITTDEAGIAVSEPIHYGKYYAKEQDTGSVYYFLNENTFEFEIKENNEIIPITIENDSVEIEVEVEKEGTTEIKPGDKVDYEFSNIENKSNIYLDNFKWYDFIPTDYIRLQNMTTGTWNQDLTYSVYYKTNKSEEYTLFKENLSTNDNYYLDFTMLEFEDDEYITETCFDFGTVETGFKEVEKPTMQCISFDTLENGDTFTNETKTVGTYYELTAEATDKWTTITHKPEEKHEEKLPRTGC